MKLYTADLHFGHTTVLRFDHRPFSNRDEMDRILIERWNERVNADDEIYILGDICYHSFYSAAWYLRQLKGRKILILGNHDLRIPSDPETRRYLESVEKMMSIEDGARTIVLCHFPLAEWDGFFRGAWHIYGHIHNKKEETYEIMKNRERALNAGCMINHYVPVTFDELVKNNEAFKNS